MIRALHFINLFSAGILAGMEIVIHYGLRGPSETLDDRSQLQLRQALVRRLRVLVPAFFLPTALSAIAIVSLEGTDRNPCLPWGGLLGLLIWIVIRIIGTVPINSATVSWDLASPPKDWKSQIARAERFHDIGVWAVILSFVCSVATTLV